MAIAPESTLVKLAVEGRGTITIELDGENAPITVGNFLDLVQRGFYDGITFHRVVDDFVAQAGDPNSKDPNFPTNLLGREGFTDPETGKTRTIPLEIKPQGADEPVVGQTFRDANITVPPVVRNDRGTIAMARGSDPNSASSQFYFNLVNSRFLDGNYAVFGRITDGLSVMDSIEVGDRIESAIVLEFEPPPSDPEPEPELDPEPEPEPPPSDLIPLQFWRLPPGDRIPVMRQMPHVGKQLEQNPGQFKGFFRLIPSGGLSLAGYYK
ncbi:MAG: peptidylprolyl isomerase [Phormidium sp. SL48-SHIP]|nr:MAG: peptidylprolyl isomerase [Phormidium sp. SL48-SHIP]